MAVLALAVPAGASTGAQQTSPQQVGYTTTGNLAAYTGVSLTSYSGHKADLTSWWVCHKLLAQPSSRGLVAIPHGLTGGGASFQTWFVPQSGQSPTR